MPHDPLNMLGPQMVSGEPIRVTVAGVEYITIDDAADELAKKYGKTGAEIYADNMALDDAARAEYKAKLEPEQQQEYQATLDAQRAEWAPQIEARRKAKEEAWQQQHYEQIRDSVGKSLKASAERGDFPVRDRLTLIRITPKAVGAGKDQGIPKLALRTYYDLVKVSELNAWLKEDGSPYRLDENKQGSGGSAWKDTVRDYATFLQAGSPGKYTSLEALAKKVAEELNFKVPPVRTDKGKALSGPNVKKALQGHITIPKPGKSQQK